MGVLSAIGKGVQKAIPKSVRVSTSGPLHAKGAESIFHPSGSGMAGKSMVHTTHTINVAKAGAMGGAGAAGVGMGNHFAHKNDVDKSVY